VERSIIDAIVILKTARFRCRHQKSLLFIPDFYAELILNDAISYLYGEEITEKSNLERILESIETWRTADRRAPRYLGTESIGDWIGTEKQDK